MTNRLRRMAYSRGFALVGVFFAATPAFAQLSATSWWPKYQRDGQNSGTVPLFSYATDVHVVWATRLSAPIVTENHASPVFSPDNSRIYVGGPASKLSAINSADGAIAWQITLGDGSGAIFQSPAIAANGAIYVGSWDSQTPYDGFAKIRDDGATAAIVWSFPLRRALASPTILPSGLIILAGQHTTDGWRMFAIRDNGADYSVVWSAGLLANSTDPNSTGRFGGTPAISADGDEVLAGSDQNRTFWQISAADGVEKARIAMNGYCFAAPATIATDGRIFIGEGQNFSAPNDTTEGRLHVFARGTDGIAARVEALALGNGHLNGGAVLRELGGGHLRAYVAANGNGKPNAKLIAVDFDPARGALDPPQPMLKKLWETTLGASAFCYPAPVLLRDATIYTIGPVNHTLYAIRDIEAVPPAADGTGGAAARGATVWSLDLSTISRVSGWTAVNQRGPQTPIVGPDGAIYWNAPDGYLYALRGWSTGDLDGDGDVDADDLALLTAAATDPTDFELRFPEVELSVVGDVNGDGAIDAADATRLGQLLGN